MLHLRTSCSLGPFKVPDPAYFRIRDSELDSLLGICILHFLMINQCIVCQMFIKTGVAPASASCLFVKSSTPSCWRILGYGIRNFIRYYLWILSGKSVNTT
jgi:hypothetical protein